MQDIIGQIEPLTAAIEEKLVGYRRDFHRYAEAGWTEFRTASLVARRLQALGCGVRVGQEVVKAEDRMGVPDPDVLERHWQRAVEQGGDEAFLEAVRGGFTGVVGLIQNGQGPTVGLRFDMDALGIQEAQDENHRPFREGFSSVNANVMHACGHDAHTATGLGLAEVLMHLRDHVRGTVKLIFQPAEEGVRGAKSMVGAEALDDVDFLLGYHVFSGWALGEMVCGMSGYAATHKFDARLTGVPAHAGASPQAGKNALQAAATAVLNLYAIPRHGDGATRINVGQLTAGTGRNVICSDAHLVIETRGATSELNDYMCERAVRVLETSARMYECALQLIPMGGAQSASSDEVLAERVKEVAERMGGFAFFPCSASGGSEDITYMMKRVQERGGLATNIGLGADLHGISRSAQEGREAVLSPHTAVFDIDERVIPQAVQLLACVALDLMHRDRE